MLKCTPTVHQLEHLTALHQCYITGEHTVATAAVGRPLARENLKRKALYVRSASCDVRNEAQRTRECGEAAHQSADSRVAGVRREVHSVVAIVGNICTVQS